MEETSSPLLQSAPKNRDFSLADHPMMYAGIKPARLLPALIPCLTGVGLAYQALAMHLDQRNFPPPGKLLAIAGRRLHLQSMGRGKPVVVLETGLGGMSAVWAWLQPEVAKLTQVVAYDRAGLGWSEAARTPTSAVAVAQRLRQLLKVSGIEGPYLLVGHSMGGLYQRIFADLFADEVCGMVLIDAAHPDQQRRSSAIDRHMKSGFQILKFVPLLARLGYVRFTRFFASMAEGLPARQGAETRAFLSSHHHLKATRDESLAFDGICAEVRRSSGLGSKPLAVVSAGKDLLPGARELQSELATLSSNSYHWVVNAADHVTLVTHRDHALHVAEIIRQLLNHLPAAAARLRGNASRLPPS